MSDARLAELIARCLLDLEFRGRLLTAPAETLQAEGLEPTPERLGEVARLKPEDLDRLGKLLERRFLGRR